MEHECRIWKSLVRKFGFVECATVGQMNQILSPCVAATRAFVLGWLTADVGPRKESETWQQNDKYKFWLLEILKEVFPDKEVKMTWSMSKVWVLEGVWMRVNPEGVYDFENITAQTAERVIQLDNGEDVLSSNQHDMKFTAAASSLGGAAASANAIDPLDQVLAQVGPGTPQEKQQQTKESAEKHIDSDSDSSSSDDEKVASKLHKPKAKSKSKPSAKSKACSSTAGAQPMANANAQPKTKIARAGSGASLGSTRSAPTVAGESAPPASVPKGANAKSQPSKKHHDDILRMKPQFKC